MIIEKAARPVYSPIRGGSGVSPGHSKGTVVVEYHQPGGVAGSVIPGRCDRFDLISHCGY